MTTNYYNTLITLAEDSPTMRSVVPDLTKQSVAAQQYLWVSEHPYELTSDEVIFRRVAEKQGIPDHLREAAHQEYFQSGRACLRTSPLAKQYGFGIHADAEGKIALVPAESDRYAALVADATVKKIPAMRKSRS